MKNLMSLIGYACIAHKLIQIGEKIGERKAYEKLISRNLKYSEKKESK